MDGNLETPAQILKGEAIVLPGISDFLLGVPPTKPLSYPQSAHTQSNRGLGDLHPFTLPLTGTQLLSPPTTAPPSISSAQDDTTRHVEAALEECLDQPDPDFVKLGHLISQLLHGPVEPAYKQGWYRPQSPNNRFSPRVEAKINGLTKDELVREFFYRNEARQAYGEQVTLPRRPGKETNGLETPTTEPTTESLKTECHTVSLAQLCKHHGARDDHRELERNRRDRHRDLQMQSALRSCDIATECGETHADEDKLLHGTRRTRSKGPGKDEQLYTAIYSHEFSARVVQSEHDGRKRAEHMVRLLLHYLVQGQNEKSRGQSMGSSGPREHLACAGQKRPRSVFEEDLHPDQDQDQGNRQTAQKRFDDRRLLRPSYQVHT